MNVFSFGSAALLGLILIGAVASADPDPNTPDARMKIDNVLAKLTLYEMGDDLGELTMKELEAAYQEYNNWSPAVKASVRSREPLVQFLHDFLMLPMYKFHLQVGHSKADPKIQNAFIERLELNYKRFKPLYFGRQTSKDFQRSPKTEVVLRSVFELKDAPALTGKMVQAAKNEYMALKAKAEEIAEHEDIYASLNEFERLKNYLNRDEVIIMLNAIFPYFKSVKLFNDETARQIKEACAKELLKRNIVVQDGVLKVLVPVEAESRPTQD